MQFSDTDEAVSFFHNLVGVFENGSAFNFDLKHLAIFVIIALAINFHFVSKGISKGIERFCVMAMPLLLLIALIILVRVITLGTPDPAQPNNNIASGLGYMWNPSKTVVEVRDSIDAPWKFHDQILKNTDVDTVTNYQSEASMANTLRIRYFYWEVACPSYGSSRSQIFFSSVDLIYNLCILFKSKDDVV